MRTNIFEILTVCCSWSVLHRRCWNVGCRSLSIHPSRVTNSVSGFIQAWMSVHKTNALIVYVWWRLPGCGEISIQFKLWHWPKVDYYYVFFSLLLCIHTDATLHRWSVTIAHYQSYTQHGLQCCHCTICSRQIVRNCMKKLEPFCCTENKLSSYFFWVDSHE